MRIRKDIIQIIAIVIMQLIVMMPITFALTISGVTISEIKGDSAKVSWNTDAAATGTVKYGTTADLGQIQKHTDYKTNHNLYLNGLTGETKYYVAIESKTTYGVVKVDYNSGNFYTFTTIDPTPPPQVTGLEVDSTDKTSATISWNKIDITDFKHYKVYRNNVNIINTTQISLRDTGLESGKTYKYKVSAVDTNFNEGLKSSEVSATTETDDKTAPAITGITVSSVTSNSAVIRWNTNEDANSIVNYGILGEVNREKRSNENVRTHALTLTSLSSETQYSYRIRSCDSQENCVESDIRTFYTIQGPGSGTGGGGGGSGDGNDSGGDGGDASTGFKGLEVILPEIHNENRINIEGKVTAFSKVNLYVNDMSFPLRVLGAESTSDATFLFSSVPLGAENTIKVIAEKDGEKLEKTFSLNVDSEDPIVSLEELPKLLKKKELEIKGNVNEPVTLTVFVSQGEAEPPSQVTGIETKVAANSVELTWNEVTDEDFSHYIIYREDVSAIAKAEPASYTSYKDVLVNKGETYSYRVSAVNKFGIEGEKSISAKATIGEGEAGKPKPEVIENPTEVEGESNIITQEVNGDFNVKAGLSEGINNVKLDFSDKAGNTVSFEEEIEVDFTPPILEIIKPDNNAFLYENYADNVDIIGKTDPNGYVHLFVERSPFGTLEGVSVSGLAEKLVDIDESKLHADCTLNIAGSSFCSTGADFTTKADSEGNFEFDDIDLTNWLGLSWSLDESTTTGLTSDNDYQETTTTKLLFIASDSAELRTAEIISYKVGTCWSGNFSWDVIPLTQYQSPSVISPQRLREGNEQIFFYFNYSYVGRGDNAKIKPNSVSIKRACGDLGTMGDERFNVSCKIMPDGGDSIVSGDGTTSYTTIKLNKIDGMDRWLTDDWKTFFDAVSNELTFPLKVIITYEHEVNGRTVTETQTTCQEVTYVMDNTLINPAEVLPDWLLYDFVDFLEEGIESLSKVQEQLRKIIEYTFYGCGATIILRTAAQVMRRWVSTFDEKSLQLKEAIGFGELFMGLENPENQEYCKAAVKAVKKDRKLGDLLKGIKLSYFSDADIKRCFPKTWAAWEREASLYKFFRLTCDRVFGHSTPARWTESKEDAELKEIKEKGISCENDRSVFGQTLKSKECRTFTKYPKAREYEVGQECVDKRIDVATTSLYKVDEKIEGTDDLFKLTVVDGYRATETYAVKLSENTYQTNSYKTCEEVCLGTKTDKGKNPREFLENTDFNEVGDLYTNGGYGCVTANYCETLQGKYDGKESNHKIKSAERRGYTTDCFFSLRNDKFKNPRVVSDNADERLECCCINVEKDEKSSSFYHYKDINRYAVLDEDTGGLMEGQPAPAFSSREGEGAPDKWEDMKWSYRYWKEKYETKPNNVNSKISDSKAEADKVETHFEYNPDRYIKERDFPACFGQNSWFDKTKGLFSGKNDEEEEEEEGEESEEGEGGGDEEGEEDERGGEEDEKTGSVMIIDPAKQHISAFQCLHLTGIYNRIQVLMNIMNAMAKCLISAREEGDYDGKVCKELFTQYVCSVIWYAIQLFFKDGCLPFGYSLNFEASDNKILQYFGAGFNSMWGAVADQQAELSSEYGNAKLDNLLGAGEEQLARKICLWAFGYDWEINIDSLIDISYASPFATLVSKITGSREFLTIDPQSGRARYEYRSSWMVNPGCEFRTYRVELACVSNAELADHPGINCEKVDDPNGNNCDCLNLDEERRHTFFTGNKLSQGVFEENSWKDIITSDFRYDHIKVTLYPDSRIKKEIRDSCFPTGHEEGVFYFPIRDKTIVDYANCYADATQGVFRCTGGVDMWSTTARAYFTGFKAEVFTGPENTGTEYDATEKVPVFNGDKLYVKPRIKKMEGKPVCLVYGVKKGKAPREEFYERIDVADEIELSLRISDNVKVEESLSRVGGKVENCKPDGSEKSEEACKELEKKTMSLSVDSMTIKDEYEFRFTVEDTKNDGIDLSEKSEDKIEGEFIKDLYKDGKLLIKISKLGVDKDEEVIIEIDKIDKIEKVKSFEVTGKINQVRTSTQTWTVDLALHESRDDFGDCQKYGPQLSSSLGTTKKKLTFEINKDSQADSKSANIPKVTFSGEEKYKLPDSNESGELKIPVRVTDDKGLKEIKYKVWSPEPNPEEIQLETDTITEDDLDGRKTWDGEIVISIDEIVQAGEYKVKVFVKDSENLDNDKDNQEWNFEVQCYSIDGEGDPNNYGSCVEKSQGCEEKYRLPFGATDTLGLECIGDAICCKR